MDDKQTKTTELIEELLQREDPALVGVKKILRKRQGAGALDTPLHTHTPEVFNAPTAEKSEENTTIFNDEERNQIELEKEILELKSQIEAKEQEQQIAVEEAYQAGIEEGRRVQEEVARSEFEQELQALNQQADTTIMELIQRDLMERENYFHSMTEEMLRVCYAIAEKVVNRAIELDPEIIKGVIRRALFYVADKKGVEIRVSPEDRDRVEELVTTFQSEGERFVSVTVTADSTIQPGGCVIETAAGVVDAQIDRQLQEIEQEVTRVWLETLHQQEDMDGFPEL